MFSFSWPKLRASTSSSRKLSSVRRTKLKGRDRLSVEPLEARQLLSATTYRTIDGTGNNLLHSEWGSTNEQLLRKAVAEYADGISSPAGADRPSAREISNTLATHSADATPDNRDVTAYIYIWGQFIDHDMDLTGSASPSQRFDVPVPTGDASFDPNSTGTQIIPLTRSVYDPTTGTSKSNPRQQINQITAWIDGSMVYGSDDARAAALRTLVGGKLKVQSTDVGDLPPLNADNLPIANDAHRVDNTQLFLAGDVRSNENIELTALHTIFLREHNRLADKIAAANPGLSDEEIYQRARAQVIGEIQAITYKEWLPALIGTGALPAYRGYNPKVNPDIANEFSTAAFRLHTTINDDVEFFDNEGHPIPFTYTDDYGDSVDVDGEVALFDAFFNPTMFKQAGVDGILKYGASTHAEAFDNQLVDSLRNFLFGQPGQGGLDLASLNIQRGRDHGLADYNTVRAAYGLPRVTSFAQITSDRDVQQKLKDLYGTVDNVDLWVGALAESPARGAMVGPLVQRVVADQFARLRDGDRFWYQRAFSGRQLAEIEQTTLADVIERNSDVEGLQNNVFFFKAQASGEVFVDTNKDGQQGRREIGLPGVTVQLLNDEGTVIATTVSRRDGSYSFNEFPETGDFQVQIVTPARTVLTTDGEHEFLVSAGDARVSRLDFGLTVSRLITTPAKAARVASDTASALTSALADDGFEENDSINQAANLGTIATPTTFDQLVQADANDWYRFNITSTGRANDNVTLDFQNAQGNLNLRVYNGNRQLVRSSEGVTNSETISLSGLPAGTYYVRVWGNGGVTNPSYRLTVNAGQATTPTPPATTPSQFDIQFTFTGLTASQQAIFDQAAAKWESIITGDLPSATYNGQTIDDLLISASSASIDGRGGILGQAGPDRFRSGSRLPYHGSMQFDSADLASMESNGTLLSVIIHEMGHVLGIGTLWSSKGLLSGAGTSNPIFTGTQATTAYNAIFGTNAAGVPVENGGGSGTRDSHWRESVLSNEVMTGYIGPGKNMPLSRITVGSLADIGYTVNMAAADPFTPPTFSVLDTLA